MKGPKSFGSRQTPIDASKAVCQPFSFSELSSKNMRWPQIHFLTMSEKSDSVGFFSHHRLCPLIYKGIVPRSFFLKLK
jgi:hypothetical protein